MVLASSSPGFQFPFPEPSRNINKLKNCESGTPHREQKQSQSDPLGRPSDRSKAACLSQDTSPWSLKPKPGCTSASESQLTTGLDCSWKLSSPGEINTTQMALSWKKSISLQNPQVSTVRDTDTDCPCECYCPRIQGQACGAGGGGVGWGGDWIPQPLSLFQLWFGHSAVWLLSSGRLQVAPEPFPSLWPSTGRRKVRGSHGPWQTFLLFTRRPSQPHLDCGHSQLCAPMPPPPSLRGMRGEVLVVLGLPHWAGGM
jgi:hypothetical protein